MRILFSALTTLALVLFAAAMSLAGADEPATKEFSRAPRHRAPQELLLQNELRAARQDGDVARTRAVQQQLANLHGFVPRTQAVPSFAEMPRPVETPPSVNSPSIWGNDILVHSGPVAGHSLRRLATEVDDSGNVYVGGIISAGGLEWVYVYKSTNNGLTWSLVNGAGVPNVQSFSLHVTDTTGGHIVGVAMTSTASATRYDGILYWIRFHDDGTGWIATSIGSPGGGYGYSDPSVVSDGFDYSPTVTWWYAAAALTDSNGTSNGLIAFRSIDWGATWPYSDTVRMGLQDYFPTIEYENVWAPISISRRPNLAIPDNNAAGVRDSIFLPPIDVFRVHVRIDTIIHTYVGDLVMRLISPLGDTVRLMNRPGGGTFGSSGNNFIGTVLVDTAATSIESILSTGSPPLGPPYTGFFSPDPDALSALNGEQFEGYWKLVVADVEAADVGTLVRWSLIIEPADYEEVYVSGHYQGNVRLFKEGSGFGLGSTSVWPTYFLTNSFSDNAPDLAIGRGDGNMILPYESLGDLRYFYSTDGGVMWNGPLNVSATTRTEDFVSANIYQTTTTSFYRVAYRDAGDSVMYKGTGSIGNIGGAAATRVNQFTPTPSSRPEVGSHGVGAGSNGHAVYAGFGPTNIYYDGFDISVGVANDGQPIPKEFALSQNYPNPFNPSTDIRYAVSRSGPVTLKIYNIIGQELVTLVNADQDAGYYTVRFDASSFPTGVYFYRLHAGSFVDTKKMLLVK